MSKTSVVILGATGSIGTQTIELIRKNREKFEVLAITANQNEQLLSQFQNEFNLDNSRIALAEKDGFEKVLEIASIPADVVINGITGSIGLEPTLQVLANFKKHGTKLALANKESLVSGGALIRKMIGPEMTNEAIIPVDSEHSAIYQSLMAKAGGEVEKILLTASGGPFLKRSLNELKNVTPEDALKHPNWSMGKVVTINSATMMNKALELIEACYLFNVEPEAIEVAIQPTSIVHSGVKFDDGSLIMQASKPSMLLPIALGLNLGKRIENAVEQLDFSKVLNLEFLPVDNSRFPFINLARDSFKAGPLFPVVMNAANEVAVEKFLNKEIAFTKIPEIVDQKLNSFNVKNFTDNSESPTLEEIKCVEEYARKS